MTTLAAGLAGLQFFGVTAQTATTLTILQAGLLIAFVVATTLSSVALLMAYYALRSARTAVALREDSLPAAAVAPRVDLPHSMHRHSALWPVAAMLAMVFAISLFLVFVVGMRRTVDLDMGLECSPLIPTIRDKSFRNVTITLDNHAYVDCHFRDVCFSYSGAPFTLKGVVVNPTVCPGDERLVRYQSLLDAFGFMHPATSRPDMEVLQGPQINLR